MVVCHQAGDGHVNLSSNSLRTDMVRNVLAQMVSHLDPNTPCHMGNSVVSGVIHS